jgi:putative flippase GtrA
MRFFLVSVAALGLNLLLLRTLVELGAGKVLAQAIAIVLVMPFSFTANKLWSFRG